MLLLGQSTGIQPIDIVQMAGQFGSVGFAVWFAYYAISKLIPELVKDFRADTKEQRTDFLRHLEQLNSSLDALPRAIGENTEATKKLDSHVVRIVARMDSSDKQMKDFRLVWRRHVRVLREIAEGVGRAAEASEHLKFIETLLDGDGE